MTPEEQAEEQYQALLKKRLDILRQQQRIQRDIARAQREEYLTTRNPLAEAQQRLRVIQEERAANRERAQADQQARIHDLRQRFGVAGQMYGRLEQAGQSRFAKVAGTGLAAFGATVGGMARSGFSGTVEQNAFDYEWKLLTREVAAAFKPVLELMTKGVSSVRRFMEGLDGSGQRMVMIAGLLGGAYGTLRVARTVGGVLGMAGSVLGGGAGLGSLAGLGGAAATSGGGGRSSGGGAAATSKAANLKGGGMRSPPVVASPPAGRMGLASQIGTAAGAFKALTDAGEEYDRFSTTGATGRNIAHFAMRAIEPIDGGFLRRQIDDELEKRGAAGGTTPRAKRPRDTVTPAEAAYEDVGSAYKRASISFLNSTAYEQSNRETGPMGNPVATPEETVAGLKKIADILERMEQQTAPNKQVN